jgi:hypothetical protein
VGARARRGAERLAGTSSLAAGPSATAPVRCFMKPVSGSQAAASCRRTAPPASNRCRPRIFGILRVARGLRQPRGLTNGDAPLLLIKDPRLCRLMPLYAAALERLDIDLRVVLCLRHPREVALSLFVRDGTEIAAAEMLWARHVIEAEMHSRAHPRAWTSFDALLNDCHAATRTIGRDLGFPWLVDTSAGAVDLREIAQPIHRHWVMANGSADRSASPFLQRVWQAACCGLAGGEADARAQFDESREMLDEFDRYHQGPDRRLDAMCGSVSWRLTAPLRHLKHALLGGWLSGRGRRTLPLMLTSPE